MTVLQIITQVSNSRKKILKHIKTNRFIKKRISISLMNFRKAKNEEAGDILALYRSVVGLPFCVWDDYPGEPEIQGDLAAGTLFVLEQDSELLGAISIVPENEMDDLDCWKVNEGAREFARVVIAPKHQGEGLSRVLLDGIWKEFIKLGVPSVHISVAKVNIPAQKLYRRFGFEFCGEKDMYGSSYFLREKLVREESAHKG